MVIYFYKHKLCFCLLTFPASNVLKRLAPRTLLLLRLRGKVQDNVEHVLIDQVSKTAVMQKSDSSRKSQPTVCWLGFPYETNCVCGSEYKLHASLHRMEVAVVGQVVLVKIVVRVIEHHLDKPVEAVVGADSP